MEIGFTLFWDPFSLLCFLHHLLPDISPHYTVLHFWGKKGSLFRSNFEPPHIMIEPTIFPGTPFPLLTRTRRTSNPPKPKKMQSCITSSMRGLIFSAAWAYPTSSPAASTMPAAPPLTAAATVQSLPPGSSPPSPEQPSKYLPRLLMLSKHSVLLLLT